MDLCQFKVLPAPISECVHTSNMTTGIVNDYKHMN